MPTAPSSTDRPALPAAPLITRAELVRSMADVGAVARFRFGGARQRRRVALSVIVLLAVTAFFAFGGAASDPNALPASMTNGNLRDYLAGAFVGFILINLASSVASGGGRELLARDQGVPFPLSPITDHFGALLMAPLNLAWLVQAWMLLALTGFVAGTEGLLPGVLLTGLFIAFGTGLAQLVGWSVEWVRRGPRGRLLIRTAGVALGVVVALLQVTGLLFPALRAVPTGALAATIAQGGEPGAWGSWLGWLLLLLVITAGVVVAGVIPAAAVGRRAAADEDRADSRRHSPRADATSDFLTLLRFDRTSVYRAVPLRRGLITLTAMPAIGAAAFAPDWAMLVLLPGLIASGGALLFGVNAWCLDGRGMLWRESLPASPTLSYDVRSWLLLESLAFSAMMPIVAGGLRAGVPTMAEAAAALSVLVVVLVQITATSMSWSVHNPQSADLRSARATPASPLIMVGYSARLAFSTTMIGLFFGALGTTVAWWVVAAWATPFLTWSTVRWLRARRAWCEPAVRGLVTVTVSAT